MSDLLTLELLYIVDVLVSIDTGAQVAIILLAFRPCVVLGYPTFTSIPQVDGLSTDTPVLGRHIYKRRTMFAYLRGLFMV